MFDVTRGVVVGQSSPILINLNIEAGRPDKEKAAVKDLRVQLVAHGCSIEGRQCC